jgi:predicted aspartyl protease
VARRLAALATALLLGCGGGGGGGGGGGAAGTAATSDVVGGAVNNGVMSVPVSVEGAAEQPFVVDTGSVMTRLDPTRFAGLGIQPGLDQVSSLDVGTLHLMNVEIVAATLCGAMMMCRGSEPAGLLGGDILINYRVTIDYRGGVVTFGVFTPPAGVGPPVMASFALEGGGQGTIGGKPVTLAATRVSLAVVLEGRTMQMVLDTGSSTIILRPDVYDALVADGRAQSSIDVATVLGTQQAPLTRVHSVAVGDAVQSEVDAVRAPLDVEALELEVGHRVDGLLGGAFLSAYATTLDYPARTLTLRPYIEPTTAR